MDLARHPRALLRDHAPDLRGPDRAPDADEQDGVGEEPQEVALRYVLARERRREHRLELGEQPDRRAEGEPAVEVLAVRAVAEAEADERDQAEHGLERDRGGQQAGRPGPGRAAAASRACGRYPQRPQGCGEQGDGQEGGHPPRDPPAGERGRCDQRRCDQPAAIRAQASARPTEPPSSTGAIAKASVLAAITKNPHSR